MRAYKLEHSFASFNCKRKLGLGRASEEADAADLGPERPSDEFLNREFFALIKKLMLPVLAEEAVEVAAVEED